LVASAGTMSAPSTSPSRTLAIACLRVSTYTGSTDLNSSRAYLETSRRWPPTVKLVSPGASSLTTATFGLSGPRDSERPISTEMISG
jgi:hypothetical protein